MGGLGVRRSGGTCVSEELRFFSEIQKNLRSAVMRPPIQAEPDRLADSDDRAAAMAELSTRDEAISAGSGVVEVDPDGRVRAEIGFGREDVAPLAAGQPLVDRIHVADRVPLLRALSDARAGSPAQAIEVRFNRHAPGEGQAFLTASMIVLTRCRGSAIAIAFVDQTPSESVFETPIEADRLAVVSHELRTPLNAIIGFSELLRGEGAAALPEERSREYGGLIHDAASHLLSVVNTMLDVSKIGAGRYAIRRERFDLAEVIGAGTTMLAPRATAKAIHVNVHLERVGAPAFADRRAFKQIVINLLSNAIKFTPSHGCVTIEAETEADGLTLTVSDTGIGIAVEDIERLGRPFHQIDNSYTRQCEGTGLGLSLVKGLAGLHGGDVHIESTPSIGTRVIVRLPATPVTERDRAVSRGVSHLPARTALTLQRIEEDRLHAPLRFG